MIVGSARLIQLPKEHSILLTNNGEDAAPNHYTHKQQALPTTISIADKLAKLARLKGQGIISESEFQQMKQELLKKM